MALPYFYALSSSMFPLGQALMPDRSQVFEPAMTLEECKLLGQKLGMHMIAPIHFKDPVQVQALRDFDAEISRFEGVEDLGLVKILRMLPELDPRIIHEAVKTERRLMPAQFRTIETALTTEACQHVDVCQAYLDLGLIDAGTVFDRLLELSRSKQSFIELITPLLCRYQRSSNPAIAEMLSEFKHEM